MLRRCLLIALCFGCVQAGHTSPLRQPDDTPVNDTNESDKANQTIKVSKFLYQNFVPRPKSGITKKQLDATVNYWLEKLGSELPLRELHGIADELTRFYRDRGFLLTRVLLKPQEIRAGVVVLTIEEGRLGEIVVSGNTAYQSKAIARPFLPILNEVLEKKDMDLALAEMEKLPGLDIFSYFSSSTQNGYSRINLKVLNENPHPWQASIKMDNFGTEQTGEARAYADFDIANVSGWGEQVKIGLLKGLQTQSSALGFININSHFYGRNTRLNLFLSNSSFELGENFEPLLISGKGLESKISISKPLLSTDRWKGSVRFGVGYLDSDVESILLPSAIDSQLEVSHALLHTHWLHRPTTTFNQSFSLSLTALKQSLRKITKTSAQNSVLEAGYQFSWVLSTFKKTGAWVWMQKINAQYSDDALPSNFTDALSGPFFNRALETGTVSADSSLKWSTDLFVPMFPSYYQWIERFRPFLFMDYALGTTNSTDTDYELLSSGVGLEWGWHDKFQARFTWGRAITEEQTVDAITTNLSEKNRKKAYLTLTYFFN